MIRLAVSGLLTCVMAFAPAAGVGVDVQSVADDGTRIACPAYPACKRIPRCVSICKA